MTKAFISTDELESNHYDSSFFESVDGEQVILRTTEGDYELFAIRDSYSGWCINTEDGRVLEFVCSLPDHQPVVN